ncbi:hypothetical protein BB561_004765 [Smittium simulii]|uniref:BRCT domain-containing protein n=1 Tax=Smittium simulii TaxID=133385 RepID=A0A2T9YEJ3_9FUNG|nr:hypothetical protein BB561_004765 [Smittium simulii]
MQLLSSYVRNSPTRTPSKVQFTVGKIDAGMAVLLTNENQLIEFPSILLPSGVGAGSVVSVSVFKDTEEETTRLSSFDILQKAILQTYGTTQPQEPVLKLRSVTQTFAILEWDKLNIGHTEFKQLFLYKDGQRVPMYLQKSLKLANTHNFTKISGLDINHEYNFSIELVTSSGTYSSNKLTVKTHTLDNLEGICVCFGAFNSTTHSNAKSDGSVDQESPEIGKLKQVIQRIGAKWSDDVTVDVTHFICQIPEGPKFELATAYNIPVVKPEWLLACEDDKKLQPSINFYLNN